MSLIRVSLVTTVFPLILTGCGGVSSWVSAAGKATDKLVTPIIEGGTVGATPTPAPTPTPTPAPTPTPTPAPTPTPTPAPTPTPTPTGDTTPPDVDGLSVYTYWSEEWSTTNAPSIEWDAATDDSPEGVVDYKLAIGTAPGLTDVYPYTSQGTSTYVDLTGLTLARGQMYYPSVKAYDTTGNVSDVISGGSWGVKAEQWITNGQVNSIIKQDSKVFLGGSFTKVGPWVGGGVPLKAADGTFNWPNSSLRTRVAGAVYSSSPDGAGGIFIAGAFTHVGGVARNNIAHILSDGTVDPAFAPTVNGLVDTIAVAGSTMYLSGYFSTVSGAARSNFAAISTTNGAVVGGFAPVVFNTTVRSMVVSGTTLFVGGEFSFIDGVARNKLAALNATSGALLSFDPNLNGNVRSLALSGTTLYVAGEFTMASATTRNRVAAFSTLDGTLVAGFNPNVNGAVNSIAVSGTSLLLGGSFTTIGGQVRSNVGAVALANGAVGTFAPTVVGNVSAIAVTATNAIVGGSITSVQSQPKNNIASIVLADASLDSGFNASLDNSVGSLTLIGSDIYVGGSFSISSPTDVKNLVALSSITGQVLAGFTPTVGDTIRTMALSPSGATLYFGGDFTTALGSARNYMAAISTATGALVAGFNPDFNGVVRTIAPSGANVFVGGVFTTVAGVSHERIAAVNATTGALQASFFPAGSNNFEVNSILISGPTTYVAGKFDSVSGQGPSNLAAFTTSNGLELATFVPAIRGEVHALAIQGSTLFIGGEFDRIDGGNFYNLGAVSATTGAHIAAFNPSVDDFVWKLHVTDNALIVGGRFYEVGGQVTSGLAAVSPTTGALLPYSFANQGVDANAFFQDGGTLYIGGGFSSIGGSPANITPVDANTGAWLPGY